MSHWGPTKNDVESFREKYPNLTFELREVKNLEAHYIEISEVERNEGKEETSLVFSNTEVLAKALDATSGFLNLRFLEPEIGVAVADSVCILVGGLTKRPFEWFVYDHMDQQFDTFIGFVSQIKMSPLKIKNPAHWLSVPLKSALALDYYQRSLDPEIVEVLAQELFKTKPSAPVVLEDEELKAQQLASAAATLLASRVRTQEDLVRALIDTSLPSAETGYIVVKNQSMNRDTLDRNWRELMDWAQLKYYSIHSVMPSTMREWPMFRTTERAVPSPASEDIATSAKPKRMRYSPVEHEPLGYIRVAEASTLPAFTYLSLYHVLEYFFDEVVYDDLQSEIRKVLSSPKLESNREKYVRAITDLIESFESPIRKDEEKLKLTLKRFIPFSTLRDDAPAEVLETLGKSIKFEGGLKLGSVDFRDEDRFFGDLATRVYTMRNAIVHSKHAESEVKGSYDPGGKDAGRVEKESEMLKHFVLEVMFRSGSLG